MQEVKIPDQPGGIFCLGLDSQTSHVDLSSIQLACYERQMTSGPVPFIAPGCGGFLIIPQHFPRMGAIRVACRCSSPAPLPLIILNSPQAKLPYFS